MSFPRAGRVCAAQILAESATRERFQTEQQLATEAGVCVRSPTPQHAALASAGGLQPSPPASRHLRRRQFPVAGFIHLPSGLVECVTFHNELLRPAGEGARPG